MASSVLATPYPSESGHWYDAKTGEPRYRIVGANGVERNTTLADAKKWGGLVPGYSTIEGCRNKPALNDWKETQAILAALTIGRGEDESDESFVKRVKADANEQAKKAAARGTEIHSAVEAHYAGRPYDPALAPWVESITGLVTQEFGAQEWRPEKSFASPLGYGGKVDLHSASVLLDFKGKEGNRGKWKVWDEHAMQLAAYQMGLMLSLDATCGIIFFDRDTPYSEFYEVKAAALNRGWAMFTALLDYWYAQTGLERR